MKKVGVGIGVAIDGNSGGITQSVG